MGGGVSSPVKTVEKAVQLSSENGIIVVAKGTYIFTKNWKISFGCDKGLKIIGDFCKTIFDIHNVTSGVKMNVEFYNITFIKTNYTGDSRIIFYDTYGYIKFHFYNCIFKKVGNYPESHYFYFMNNGNDNYSKWVLFKNCTFANNLDITTIGITKVVNCAFSKESLYYQSYYTNTLTGCILNDNFYITNKEFKNIGEGVNPNNSRAHIGVYGGEFAIAKKDTNKWNGYSGIISITKGSEYYNQTKDILTINNEDINSSNIFSEDLPTITNKININLSRVTEEIEPVYKNTLVISNYIGGIEDIQLE